MFHLGSTQQLSKNQLSLKNAPRAAVPKRQSLKVQASAKALRPEDVADMNKRNIMNVLTYGALGLNVVVLGGPYAYSLFPQLPPAGAGANAKDKIGNDIKAEDWLAKHQPGDKSLIQGLKGDVYYLLVNDQKEIEKYALNAVCTHLGCVVPWNQAENKFKCPCHGSQYNTQGKVIRGPAPLSLALANTGLNEQGTVTLRPWKDTDFRTGQNPWWK